MVHDDRDFIFDVTPAPANLSLLTEWNMWGDAGEHGPGDLEVEWEWMFFFPPVDQHLHARSDFWWGHRLTPKFNPNVSYNPVVPIGGIPWKGDQIALRGVHVLDCGHSDGPGHTARAEIHPPTVVAWAHPEENVRHAMLVWVRATSYSTDPHRHAPFGPLFEAIFDVPGGAISGCKVELEPVQLDWVYTGYTTDNIHSCRIGDWQSPIAALANGTFSDNAAEYFEFNRQVLNDQQVRITLRPLRSENPAESAYPDLLGLHFRVCIPECNSSCQGPPTLNSCPSESCPPRDCQPSASSAEEPR